MRSRIRLVLLAGLAAAIVIVLCSPLRDHLTRNEIRALVESVRAAWYAPLVLIALYAIGSVLAVPASIFIVAAGAVWGWALGGTFAMAGGLLGAMASFYAGRFLGAGLGDGGRTRTLIDKHLRGATFRSQLIVRLLPVLPFAAVNYGSGIARVNAPSFFLATVLGLIPSNYVFAWSADEIFNGTITGRDVFARIAIVASVCAVAVAIPSWLARRTSRVANVH